MNDGPIDTGAKKYSPRIQRRWPVPIGADGWHGNDEVGDAVVVDIACPMNLRPRGIKNTCVFVAEPGGKQRRAGGFWVWRGP